MGRNRIGIIVTGVIVVLILLWLVLGIGDEAAEVTDGAEVEAPEAD